MYFQQVGEIVAGQKHCTQRCVHAGETYHCNEDGDITIVFTPGLRAKWRVGSLYAVSKHRGGLAVMVQWGDVPLIQPHPTDRAARDRLAGLGYEVLRIRLLQIEQVHVQAMDKRVAIAEGVGSVAAYAELWQSINTAKGTRWSDDPLIWRLWFETPTPAA